MLLLNAANSDSVNISQGALVSIVISILGFIGVLVTLLHKNMTEKIDKSARESKEGFQAIHTDLKPLTIKVALHEEQIKKHDEEIKDHGNRIQELEHQVDKLKT
jgi:peptidoglycan hydrolase CwlO-like protein